MNEFQERAARLRDHAERGGPASITLDDETPEFVGRFLRFEEGHTRDWGSALIAILVDEHGEQRSLWCFHTVLSRAMIRVAPQPHEMILIRYLGRRTPEGGGSAYADYRVVVDRDTEGGLTLEQAARLAQADDELPASRRAEHEPPAEPAPLPAGPPAHTDEDIPF